MRVDARRLQVTLEQQGCSLWLLPVRRDGEGSFACSCCGSQAGYVVGILTVAAVGLGQLPGHSDRARCGKHGGYRPDDELASGDSLAIN